MGAACSTLTHSCDIRATSLGQLKRCIKLLPIMYQTLFCSCTLAENPFHIGTSTTKYEIDTRYNYFDLISYVHEVALVARLVPVSNR